MNRGLRLGNLGVVLALPGCVTTGWQREESNVSDIGTVRLSLGQPIQLDDAFRKALRLECLLTSDKTLDMSVSTSGTRVRVGKTPLQISTHPQ